MSDFPSVLLFVKHAEEFEVATLNCKKDISYLVYTFALQILKMYFMGYKRCIQSRKAYSKK